MGAFCVFVPLIREAGRASTNRPGRPAQRGRTGRGKTERKGRSRGAEARTERCAAKRRRKHTHDREPRGKPPLSASQGEPKGKGPQGEEDGAGAPGRTAAAQNNGTRAGTRGPGGATQSRRGRQRWTEGGRSAGAEAQHFADAQRESIEGRFEAAAAERGRRSQGRAPVGRDDRRIEQQLAGVLAKQTDGDAAD